MSAVPGEEFSGDAVCGWDLGGVPAGRRGAAAGEVLRETAGGAVLLPDVAVEHAEWAR